MSEAQTDIESPAKRPLVVDPTHPHASPVNGNVPPEWGQFQKGNKGGPGRPRGAWPRAALARRLAKGWESDIEAENPEHRIGAKSLEMADEMIAAALRGDTDTVKACAEIINQVEGKPQEHVDHTGEGALVRIAGFDSPHDEQPVTASEVVAAGQVTP